ncbi:predicted protein [Plenodomus lingam JN3]|uniref:Predicted protein n=1 Tax=Leptosphaeria maculans (strain JN3 / isolate v23.1.3 / race Av1-4-5-6-7-8) TaxID=985895 RepID=E5AB59_LEPMJ|nr:predicted protein [Plenodomus lingam JN3]CBY00900.1 predicted protein [Plenodomus lingam JN3]
MTAQMSYGGESSMPRGDPLAGWKEENLAAPKASLQQGWQEHHLATPQHAHEPAHSYQQTLYDDHPSMMGLQDSEELASTPLPRAAASRGVTDAEKAACSQCDIRWPPPKSAHPKPLQLLLDDRDPRRIYYHLIHENLAPESKFSKKEIQSKAQSFFTQKFPPPEASPIPGKSPQDLQEAEKQADFEEKGRLRKAIITTKLQKKMREVSTGPRGSIWLLEEESVEVWRCIEVLQKGDLKKAVRIGPMVERFEIFGVGLKGEKDHVLLLSQNVDG